MTTLNKTPLDGWRLLENVVQLTGQKDRLALEHCLIGSLREMIAPQELVLTKAATIKERWFSSPWVGPELWLWQAKGIPISRLRFPKIGGSRNASHNARR